MSAHPLIVANLQIRRDTTGRYCLNDLHQAAGAEPRHQPARWLRNQQAQELIAEVAAKGSYQSLPVESCEGRYGGGTYVAKPLVYAYAVCDTRPRSTWP